MFLIKELTMKNFMSVGNVSQGIRFNNEKLTLVLGENLDQGSDGSGHRNGTGKSTIINALSYALYGQALTNIKKNNLINKTNGKGLLVTLMFEKDQTEYRIERARSPTFLKFYINGHEQNSVDESQGDSRKTQEEIDRIIGMSHSMFKHVVALNTYNEPFLSMRLADQREIIEQLLGITILSTKAERLKESIRSTKDLLSEENYKINAIKLNNEKINDSIEQLKQRQKAWKSKKKQDIKVLEDNIEEFEQLDISEEIRQHEKLLEWNKLNDSLVSLQKEKSTLENAQIHAQDSIEKIKKDISDLNSAVCYTCGQTLHDEKKNQIHEQKTSELVDAETYEKEISSKLGQIISAVDKIGDTDKKPTTFYDTIKEAYEHQSNLTTIKQTLENLKNESDPYQEQIDDLKNTALQEINWDRINKLSDLKDHQEFLLKLLTNRDSFVRKKIIDQNLSYLNKRLMFYLNSLGLSHQVIFQNDLTVEISQLGQDLDFDNLSRGERNRLILGLSFAFRDIWESLYQQINLLFIDELIDSGMDTAGVENSLGLLKHMGRERNKNVFLISHKEELVGRVSYVLKVIKENGFTSYSNDMDIYYE